MSLCCAAVAVACDALLGGSGAARMVGVIRLTGLLPRNTTSLPAPDMIRVFYRFEILLLSML
jgi:hypothetical protein